MRKKFTTPELTEAAQALLAERDRASTQGNIPNINLFPRLVECDGPSGSLTLAFDTHPWMSNPYGVTHGGIIATMLDNAMGITCYCLYNVQNPTINININYARPVPLNDTFYVRIHLIMGGSTSAQFTAELYHPSAPERLLITASGVYSVKGSSN